MSDEEKKLILFVDDEPLLSEALAFTLEARGYECITAQDMTAALAALRQRQVHVVVTDIMMPGGDKFPKVDASEAGFRFVDLVRKTWPKLPIVCLSVIGDQDKIASLTERGVRYLRKGETPLATAVEIITAMASRRRIRL
jgi:CheY-like chemotaxis protein